MNKRIPTMEDFEKAEEEYWKINPNKKPSKIWFILNHRHEYIEDNEIANRLRHEIDMMEKAEVDVQNWITEEGRREHTAILTYLKQKIRDGK